MTGRLPESYIAPEHLLDLRARVRSRRPDRGAAPGGNGGGRVGAAAVSEEWLVAAAVWETLPPKVQREVTVRLARLLARLVEAERDE